MLEGFLGFLGILGCAIAAAQLLTENTEKRRQQMLFTTAILFAVIATGGILYSIAAVVHFVNVSNKAEVVLNRMDRPSTYEEILHSGTFNSFADLDEVIDYLYNKDKIAVKTVDMRSDDGTHSVRTFIKRSAIKGQ